MADVARLRIVVDTDAQRASERRRGLGVVAKTSSASSAYSCGVTANFGHPERLGLLKCYPVRTAPGCTSPSR